MSVVVVGGGPAGLAAAIALRRLGADRVVVLDREAEPGGVPRHCDHLGFGLRDFHRVLGGPRYAARYATLAERAGVEIRTRTTATDWAGSTTLTTTSPRGLETLAADAVLLATGCRERPRSARLVPGTRPLGVLTTGALQQLVHLHHERVGRRAVVVGAEHVSFSAVLTLAGSGTETVAMVTEHAAHQTHPALAWVTARRRGVPILARTRVTAVRGRGRVEGVELTDVVSGVRRVIACDTVVFTGEWIPDHELARRGGLAMDAAKWAPCVDQAGRTSVHGVFAAGNLVHAAETADVAALGGRAAARAIAGFLERGTWPRAPIPIVCESPLAWVAPNVVDPDTLPPSRFLFRTSIERAPAELVVSQGSRALSRQRYRRLVPNRSLHAPAAWVAGLEPAGGPVVWRVVDRDPS